jgi:tetraacyldisaccharide 4'-kinase
MASNYLVSQFERLLFKPNIFDWVLIFLLSPLSLLYGTVMLLRRLLSIKKSYPLPIISIGNLTVGGSGKTPFVIALACRYGDDVAIISRGYGRKSRGLVEVSRRGKVLVDVYASGDEPMLMAESLENASVIVSEKREMAIELAMKQGAKIIFLDDGFNRVNINKYEILLFPSKIANYMTFPVGPFREFYPSKGFSNINLYENKDFFRVVTIENKREKMLLVTAISNPERLEPFLPDGIVDRVYLEDHAYFDESKLKEKFLKSEAQSLLVTEKDAVKMSGFKLPLSVMQLKLQIKNEILEKIDNHIGEYRNEK